MRERRRFALRPPLSFRVAWLGSFILLSTFGAIWGAATPFPSGGDEPAHAIKAAAVASGQLIGVRPKGYPQTSAVVRIPASVDALPRARACYYGDPNLPARACHLSVGQPNDVIAESTYVANYPPAYYAPVGLSTLVFRHPAGLRLMRLSSALIGGVFLSLALAGATAWSRNRWLVLGVASAITPVTVYNVSIVNPSGLEIAAAVAAWTAAVVLVMEGRTSTRGPLALFVASTVVMAFTRPLSFLWVPAIVMVLFFMDPAMAKSLWRDVRVKVSLAITVAAALGAAQFVVVENGLAVEHFPLPPRTSSMWIAEQLLGLIPTWITQFVGQFGSPNFGGPAIAIVIWLIGVSALIIAGFISAVRHERVWLLFYTLVSVAIFPFAATFTHARLQGLGWQGRYNLPLAVGIPLLAAALVGRRFGLSSRARGIAIAAWGLAQSISFYFVLCRYTVGLSSLFNPFRSVSEGWDPPLGVLFTLLGGVLLILLIGLWLWFCSGARFSGSGAHFGSGRSHLRRESTRTGVAS